MTATRERFLATLESYEAGKVRISTVRDLFREHLSQVSEARGEKLGALAE